MADHQQHCIVALVDDDARVRESLEHLLYSAGIEPRLFCSAEEALQPGELDSVCCLVTDVRMPGIDGCELHRRLAASFPALPVVFVTAHPDDEVRNHALAQGAFAFLYKPVDGEEFLGTVDDAVKWGRDKAFGKLPDKAQPGGSRDVDR
ncbi:MAG TPA: response regulator [Edaphobacter sp.]|nr:response regulator [Edaphobacter sp.]